MKKNKFLALTLEQPISYLFSIWTKIAVLKIELLQPVVILKVYATYPMYIFKSNSRIQP